MCKGLKLNAKNDQFWSNLPKMVPIAIFVSRLVAENEIFGDFQYEFHKKSIYDCYF